MDIHVEIDSSQFSRFTGELTRQAPFALSLGMNKIALAVQKDIQASLSQRFTLRRADFIRRTIKINRDDFATKTKLEAIVRVDPERDLLAKFEEGGIKTPFEGRHITIPTTNVRRTKTAIIPKAQRPRALFANPRSRVRVVRDLIVQSVGRAAQTTTKVLYVLRTSVRIPKKLGFHTTALATFNRTADTHLGAAIDKALATARTK